MSEEASVVRGINWRETFPFTHIFRGFRVAIHPSKLILALLLLLAMYVGGRVLDGLWPASDLAVIYSVAPTNPATPGNPLNDLTPGAGMGLNPLAGALPAAEIRRMSPDTEISRYQAYRWQGTPSQSFADIRGNMRKEVVDSYAQLLINMGFFKPDQITDATKSAERVEHLGDIKNKLLQQRDDSVKAAIKVRDDARKAADSIKDSAEQAKAYHAADVDYDRAIADAYATCTITFQQAAVIQGQGIFAQLFEYEVGQINAVVGGVLSSNWLGGLHDPTSPPGVIQATLNFCTVGPIWILRYHTIYFILFTIWFIIIWALFGGAIARIAAVHVARDEKISFRQALRFSSGKFLSFIFAPIIPLLIVLFVGVVVSVVALIGNIPWIGPPLVGIFFFLALGAAFIMTLVLIGVGGGFNLMYPTIAVEGSDSFDAISRSFSYIYARPWRMIWYTIVAVVYGALTFGFVRFFVQLMLFLVHYFVGAGFFSHVNGHISIWDSMWPWTGSRLSYDIDYLTLSWDAKFGAFCVAFWVYLLISLVGAYAISFYFSANTIIYYLMRREVDATEMDDVYLEQADEDFVDTAMPGGTAGGVVTAGAGPGSGEGTVTVTTTTVTATVDTGAAPVTGTSPAVGGPAGGSADTSPISGSASPATGADSGSGSGGAAAPSAGTEGLTQPPSGESAPNP